MKGLIFDADGVIIDMPHAEIWRKALRDYKIDSFTEQDYEFLAAGIPRRDAAKNILTFFEKPCDENSVDSLYLRKQEVTDEFIAAGKIKIYSSTLDFLLQAKATGVKMAVASSSPNAGKTLRNVKIRELVPYHTNETLYDLFDHIISGGVKPGKPNPKIFLQAAQELGESPEDCIVFEDAVPGVQAAKAGDFYCVAINRSGIEEKLKSAGADKVVLDLDMSYKSIKEEFEQKSLLVSRRLQ